MEEVWKRIRNYTDYQISNHGRIISAKRGYDKFLFIKPSSTTGYVNVGLNKDGNLGGIYNGN